MGKFTKTPQIIRPLRYLRDKLAQVGPKGEATYPPAFRRAERAAKLGNGQYVQDLARAVYAKGTL